MDAERLGSLVRFAVDYYIPILRLEGWQIDVTFTDDLDDHVYAHVNYLGSYQHAALKINVNEGVFISDEEVVKTVRHELLHLTHGMFNSHFENVINRIENTLAQEMAMDFYQNCVEQYVAEWAHRLDQWCPAVIVLGEFEGLNGTE